MFGNLLAEMARINISRMDISNKLNVAYESIRNKFLGKTEWTRSEMLNIRNIYFPNMSLEYLFEKIEKSEDIEK